MAKSEGKKFEEQIEQSCSDQSVFYFRVRDVNQTSLKKGAVVPKNKYDCLLYYKGYLFPIEMKSTKDKNISMKESMIKSYQIESLKQATKYKGVIPGFFFNFRLDENIAHFVHIDKFLEYKNIAENQLEHTYKNKINKSSIPVGIVKEIGVEIKNVKKKVNYRYYVNSLLDELINKYGDK